MPGDKYKDKVAQAIAARQPAKPVAPVQPAPARPVASPVLAVAASALQSAAAPAAAPPAPKLAVPDTAARDATLRRILQIPQNTVRARQQRCFRGDDGADGRLHGLTVSLAARQNLDWMGPGKELVRVAAERMLLRDRQRLASLSAEHRRVLVAVRRIGTYTTAVAHGNADVHCAAR